jgi:hypothetical protein
MESEKVRENRLRRVADRRGYRLIKSRVRDPKALGFGGYMLHDEQHNFTPLGFGPPYLYSATLDDVERFLDNEDADDFVNNIQRIKRAILGMASRIQGDPPKEVPVILRALDDFERLYKTPKRETPMKEKKTAKELAALILAQVRDNRITHLEVHPDSVYGWFPHVVISRPEIADAMRAEVERIARELRASYDLKHDPAK